MKVLSLFDGMSCGQIALRELGIPVKAYHASEIDRHCIAQTALNFPGTIQLGDVTRWREWDIPWGEIDLLMGGSPCQGFSVAGKGLNFDDPRSKLFFEYVDIRDHLLSVNPRARWLLENVNMKREWVGVISRHLGVFPVRINSALVSAQNRVRLYWTNVRTRREGLFDELHVDIPLPADRGIVIEDILDDEVPEKYIVPATSLERLGKDLLKHFTRVNAKARTLRNSTGRSMDRKHNFQFIITSTRVTPRKDQDKASCLVAGGKGAGNHGDMDLIVQLNPAREGAGRSQPRQQNRVYDPRYKSPALCANLSGGITGASVAILNDTVVRRLTPRECSRLQTIPGWYRWECSDTRAYRMLGNGWTVEVIKHVLSYLKNNTLKNQL